MIETLINIQTPVTKIYQYLPYEQGVYFAKFTQDVEGFGPYYSQWNSTGVNVRQLQIGSVSVDLTSYARKISLAECLADDESFFWDNPAQTLYIHFLFDHIPETISLVVGSTNGFSYKQVQYIDDVEYEPRIQTVPNIKRAVDKFEVGKMSFQDQTVTLSNGDGELDDFIQNPIPGAEASIILYDTVTDTQLSYYTGFIRGDSDTTETFRFNIQDKRRSENVKVPKTRFDTTTYPSIESKYVGDIIPEGYGDLNRITAFPVNGDESSPTNISYRYLTDATTLTKVEVEDDNIWTDVTGSVLNSVPSTGSFDLPLATATNSAGGLLDCVVTVTARTEENPGDIISDMNDRYNSVSFDSSNYNTTEWATEKAKLADVALYMDKNQEFFKWIELLQNGSNKWFVYDIEGDGKRTLRVNDPDRAVARTIDYVEIKGDLKPVERDFTEVSSTVAVLYNLDVEDDVYERIDVNTFETQVLEQYGFPQNSEFESLLTAQVDAQRKADLIAEDQSDARPVATVVLHGDALADLDLKLYDVVNLNLTKPAGKYWEDVPDEVFSDWSATDENFYDYTATDEVFWNIGELVSRGDGRAYWGTIRGQVLGIDYNPTNFDYTLTIRERPESEVI